MPRSHPLAPQRLQDEVEPGEKSRREEEGGKSVDRREKTDKRESGREEKSKRREEAKGVGKNGTKEVKQCD